MKIIVRSVLLGLGLVLVLASPAAADDCSGVRDCFTSIGSALAGAAGLAGGIAGAYLAGGFAGGAGGGIGGPASGEGGAAGAAAAAAPPSSHTPGERGAPAPAESTGRGAEPGRPGASERTAPEAPAPHAPSADGGSQWGEKDADGGRDLLGPNGEIVGHRNANGTGWVQDPDGSKSMVSDPPSAAPTPPPTPTGTRASGTSASSGTPVPDAEVVGDELVGTTDERGITRVADGAVTVPDGRGGSTTTWPNGNKKIEHPDGSTTIIEGNTTTQYDADGNFVSKTTNSPFD